MVGDNEATDIIGAHKAGWESIMVKTGVTKHDSQYATHNCDTLLEGFHKYKLTKWKGKADWVMINSFIKYSLVLYHSKMS